jgi:hypothetical protein
MNHSLLLEEIGCHFINHLHYSMDEMTTVPNKKEYM